MRTSMGSCRANLETYQADPDSMENAPFDSARMIYGGLQSFVDL